ncbi:MAG TPA: maleylpyruvate isomerase family mycothiol-dependent enzyme [Pseudonocardiaceae bacterium]|nr:maleylpyruvate isomerase family mycothiol-dependent enzyme [Pseudonocardiaceae bacterium]
MPALRTQLSDTDTQSHTESSHGRSDAAQVAHDGLVAVRRVSEALHEIVDGMNEATMHGASRLPGWTRGHVVSHLARNADGLLNLLIWARTGIEHPMYASTADRDADIEEGAPRLARVQQEDLRAAQQRFLRAADRLSPSDWSAQVTDRRGRPIDASLVPWMRLTELLVHQVDLGVGVDFDRVAELVGAQAEPFLHYVVTRFDNRADVPAVRLTVSLGDDASRVWTLGQGDQVSEVHGRVAAAAAWLTGREYDGADPLGGDVPRLPAWL